MLEDFKFMNIFIFGFIIAWRLDINDCYSFGAGLSQGYLLD